LQFADLQNRRTREVYRDKRIIELTAKEFDLLDYLLAILAKSSPASAILENDFMGDSNIEVYIRCVSVEANNEKRACSKRVRSVGYVLQN